MLTYGYGHRNQMVLAERRTTDEGTLELRAEYRYDAQGSRIETAVDEDGNATTDRTIRYVLDGWNPAKPSPVGTENVDVLLDLDGTGSLTTRYLRGDVVDQLFARVDGTDPYWYLTDRQGSIRHIVDDTGVVVKSLAYDGYGNITSETGAGELGRYAYTGREFDVEIGMQYNRARYYDASTGRWTSQDPLGYDAGDSNLYRYVHNRLTGATDPSGMLFLNDPKSGKAQTKEKQIKTILKTSPGNWLIYQEAIYYNKKIANTSIRIAEAATRIYFIPNPSRVKSDEIALIQIVRMLDQRNSPWTQVGHEKISTNTGWHIDNHKNSTMPWYGILSNGKPQSKEIVIGRPKSKNPGERVCMIEDYPGGQVTIFRGFSWEFETYVVAKSGADAGTVFGGISWGFSMTDEFRISFSPVKLINGRSSDFSNALKKWNAIPGNFK